MACQDHESGINQLRLHTEASRSFLSSIMCKALQLWISAYTASFWYTLGFWHANSSDSVISEQLAY